MKNQSERFFLGEGDKWLDRNRDRLGVGTDPVATAIEAANIKPTRVLEIGCSNGWRLAALKKKYGCEVFGVEPSMKACIEAADLKVPVWQMSAATLPELGPKFDLVIYGFCLYLTEPSDWFNIAREGDNALAPGGHMIIHDFSARGDEFARRYEHCDGVFSYHVDFAKLWLAHPLYRAVRTDRILDEDVAVLKKEPREFIEVRA